MNPILIMKTEYLYMPTPDFAIHLAGERPHSAPMHIRFGRSSLFYSGDILVGVDHDNNVLRLNPGAVLNKTTANRIKRHITILGLEASWVRPAGTSELLKELAKVYEQAFRDYARGRFTENQS